VRLSSHALSAGLAATLARLTALARELAFAAAFGAGLESDALLAAWRVPNLFRDLFAEGSMANAFVPTFARTAEEEGLASAWRLANALLGLVALATGGLVLLMVVAAGPLVSVVAAGYADVPGKAELTATLVRWVAPFLACVSLASLFGGMLNVRGRFFLPALAPAAMNVAVVAACVAPARLWEAVGIAPIAGVAAASTAGGALGFLIQLPALRREGFRLRPSLGGHPALRRLLAFLGPALAGLATIQVGVLVDVQLAAAFGDGPVSWMSYAFRVVQLPMTLFAGSVAVAGLALLSTAVARGQREQARDSLAEAVGLSTFLVLPAAVALAIFPDTAVRLLFERGAFGPEDTVATATLLRAYAFGALAFGLHRVVLPAFFAWGDAWTPMWLGAAAVAVKVPLAIGASRALGVQGIPLAHAIAASVEVIAMLALLGRLSGGWTRRFWSEHARMAACAALMAGVGLGARTLAAGTVAELAAMGLSGVVFVGAAFALRVPYPAAALGRLRGPRGLPPHVEPTTVAAFAEHAGASLIDVVSADDTVRVRTTAGELTLSARDGLLLARSRAESASAAGSPLVMTGFLDPAVRPPPLRGLVLVAGASRWAFVARGARIEPEEPVGAPVEVI
jgi:putative peptidoglycan lipid II flippase